MALLQVTKIGFCSPGLRFAHLLADTYISHIYGREVFSWGQSMPIRKSEARKQYIKALQQADAWDIRPLVVVARG